MLSSSTPLTLPSLDKEVKELSEHDQEKVILNASTIDAKLAEKAGQLGDKISKELDNIPEEMEAYSIIAGAWKELPKSLKEPRTPGEPWTPMRCVSATAKLSIGEDQRHIYY